MLVVRNIRSRSLGRRATRFSPSMSSSVKTWATALFSSREPPGDTVRVHVWACYSRSGRLPGWCLVARKRPIACVLGTRLIGRRSAAFLTAVFGSPGSPLSAMKLDLFDGNSGESSPERSARSPSLEAVRSPSQPPDTQVPDAGQLRPLSEIVDELAARFPTPAASDQAPYQAPYQNTSPGLLARFRSGGALFRWWGAPRH